MVPVVAPVSDDKAQVVAAFGERGSDAQVLAEPVVSGCVPVEIPRNGVEEDAQRLLRRLLNQVGVPIAAV